MLNTREKEIVELLNKGYSYVEIAKMLSISKHTVKAYVIRIRKKNVS